MALARFVSSSSRSPAHPLRVPLQVSRTLGVRPRVDLTQKLREGEEKVPNWAAHLSEDLSDSCIMNNSLEVKSRAQDNCSEERLLALVGQDTLQDHLSM